VAVVMAAVAELNHRRLHARKPKHDRQTTRRNGDHV